MPCAPLRMPDVVLKLITLFCQDHFNPYFSRLLASDSAAARASSSDNLCVAVNEMSGVSIMVTSIFSDVCVVGMATGFCGWHAGSSSKMRRMYFILFLCRLHRVWDR